MVVSGGGEQIGCRGWVGVDSQSANGQQSLSVKFSLGYPEGFTFVVT